MPVTRTQTTVTDTPAAAAPAAALALAVVWAGFPGLVWRPSLATGSSESLTGTGRLRLAEPASHSAQSQMKMFRRTPDDRVTTPSLQTGLILLNHIAC
jgi:hypothetical protein